jgi:hypothetical protein
MKLYGCLATPRVSVQHGYVILIILASIGNARTDGTARSGVPGDYQCEGNVRTNCTTRREVPGDFHCGGIEDKIMNNGWCPNHFYNGLFVSDEDIDKLPNDADNMTATLGNYTVLKTFPLDVSNPTGRGVRAANPCCQT